jgi:hypothetical protein
MGGKRQKHKTRNKTPKRKIKQSEPPLVVFISSLIDTMMEERNAVERGVLDNPITVHWRFEDTPASSQPLEESYLSRVRTCDFFVLVLGVGYSKPVVREYETALETNRPILAFVYDGKKEPEQEELVRSLRKKYRYNPYSMPSELRGLVAGSINDELIRDHRSSVLLRATDTRQRIQNMPLIVRKSEEMAGYLVVGLEEDKPGDMYNTVYENLLLKAPPEDLKQFSPAFEPVYIENLSQMEEASNAIKHANEKARATTPHNRETVFLEEIKREIIEIASRYVLRQQTNTPEPEVTIPGIKYYIWGLEPNLARLFKLARLEGTARPAIQVQRNAREFFFKNAERFTRVMTFIQDAAQRAYGDDNEFRRLLWVEGGLMITEDYEEEQKKNQEQDKTKDDTGNVKT